MNAMIDINPSILSPDAAQRAGATEATVALGDDSTDDAAAADRISGLRERIDEIDNTLVQLWLERAAISAEVGRVRIASGGTRLVLSREREIVDRFRDALGPDGVQLALLILRAGRGPL